MSRKIVFEASAFNDFNQWSFQDKTIYKKIIKLMKEIERSPFSGIGKVVERTFGWLMQCRRLVRDYERLPETSETFIYLAMIRIMVKRLA